ncbi:MAG TPA: PExPT-CTERM protein [Terriglobales bacterium]|nr:PExPT-CTERM protein [Terriglobales bacterium]
MSIQALAKGVRGLSAPIVVLFLVVLIPIHAEARRRRSPENPTIILGLLGSAGVTWKYVRARSGR